MKKIILVALTFISGLVAVHSQSIKGKLVDLVDSKPLAGATLTLVSLKDSTQIRRMVARLTSGDNLVDRMLRTPASKA